jgi:L-fucose isomerase
MKLVNEVALFLEENLRFPSGEHVEYVIADTCIGGVAEAALCSDKFKSENIGV